MTRILVLANETCAGEAVLDEVRYRAGDGAEVLVVAPVLASSRAAHWLGAGTGDARAAARERLDLSVSALRSAGIAARGQIGDSDPLQALDDAIRVFHPEQVIISTHPPAHSTWLERKVVEQARQRYPVPVTHVVVDLVHESERVERDGRPGPRVPVHMITLYHSADYDEAVALQRDGFRDGPVETGTGVLFVTVPPVGSQEGSIFSIDVPAASVSEFEIEGVGDERRFVLPADLANRSATRVLAADWSE